MDKPVIVFDFDGTLVDKNGRIHPRDVHILRDETRALFVPATGRPLHAVRRAFERHGLFTGVPIPFPMVLQNGAALYKPGEVLFAHTPFAPEVQAGLLATLQRHKQVCCVLFGVTQSEILWPNPAGLRMIERFDLLVTPFNPAGQVYTKLIGVAAGPGAMAALTAELAGLPLEASYSLPTVLELTPQGVDKGAKLLELLSGLGLQEARIAAAGDGENDLPLFKAAQRTFCPSSSPEVIRAQTGAVIDVAQTGLLGPMMEGNAPLPLRGRGRG